MKKRTLIYKKIINGLFVFLLLLFIIPLFNHKASLVKVNAVDGVDSWNGVVNNSNDITVINDNNVIKYITFTDFISDLVIYQNYDISSFKVVIETANDLSHLSMLCNDVQIDNYTIPVAKEPEYYLSLYYVLGNDLSFNAQRVYPIGTLLYPFTGTFDGQGFKITDLFLANLNVNEYSTIYGDSLDAYGFFGCIGETGVIKRFLLVNPTAVQANAVLDNNNEILYAAPLAGYNYGLIEAIGLVEDNPTGSFQIHSEIHTSTMVCINGAGGTITDSFVSLNNNYFTNEITNDTNDALVVVYREELTSIISNVYYDATVYVTQDIVSDNVTPLETNQFQIPNNFSTTFRNKWFFNANYNDIIVNNTYPVLQGLRLYNDSTDTYSISSAIDMLTLARIMTLYSQMASKKYILTNCIDMNAISKDAYVASTTIFSGTFESEAVTNDTTCLHNHNVSSATVKYHSIWNLNLKKSSAGDNTTYGLFNTISGTIKNINIVNININPTDLTTYKNNVVYIGTLTGVSTNTADIQNINIYGNIQIPSSTSNGLFGILNIGGIVGKNSGIINSSSFNGYINGGVQYYSTSTQLYQTNGIGGIVGKAEGGEVINVRNNASIIGMGFSSYGATTYVGGIIGYGVYTKLSNVVNNGLIISHNNSLSKLGKTFIGGIVSKVTSTSSITEKVINNGDIHLMLGNDSNTTMASPSYYVAGFGTLSTSSTTNTDLSNLINNGSIEISRSYTLSNNIYTFNNDFSAYTNLTVTSGGTTINPTNNIGGAIKLTGVIIIDANTSCTLNGIFNKHDQTIDLGLLYRYAPVIYSLNTSSTYQINVIKAYNTGNLNFVTTRSMYNPKVSISGNTYGDYINFYSIRNTGNLDVQITYASTNTFNLNGSLTDKYSNFRISGLIGTVQNGYHIYDSYNGGNIEVRNYTDNSKTTLLSSTTVAQSSNLQYMLCIGGIAFKNGNETDVESIDNVIIRSTLKGGIYNCINDGDIYVNVAIFGCSRIGGIAEINNGLIASCFNTGSIYNYAGIDSSKDFSGGEFEVESSGIACMLCAETSQIMDCANYGNIMSVCPKTGGSGWLNTSGIAGRNDKAEVQDGNNTRAAWKGKIEFCVNYGNIYSWNAVNEGFGNFLNGNSNTAYYGAETGCKASGILAIGVINVINCVNYGNTSSRYLAGGIFGLVDGTKFKTISSNIYIANSINYGKPRPITAFNDSETILENKFTVSSTVPARRSVSVGGTSYINPMYGALIAYIYGHSNWSRSGITSGNYYWDENQVVMLSHLQISFLINFDSATDIIGSQSLATSALTDDKLQKYSLMVKYMATTKSEDTSMYPFNSSNNYTASYNGEEYGIVSYGLGTANGQIFGNDFPLRGGELDTTIETNNYIRNYISFVEYQYTNETLVDKLFTASSRVGIYAVSSSKGILNGSYIPDNINWGTASSMAIDPVENGVVQTTWRGTVDDTSSINYKFNKGMRQLKASIATTVYDLKLVAVNNSDLILDAPTVDVANKTITFYVGDNEGAEGNGSIIDNRLSLTPTVDSANKLITYYSGSVIIAQYDYSTGQLIRIDNSGYYVDYDPTDASTITTQAYIYSVAKPTTLSSISSYYVTKDNGLTYQQATDSDKLFTITVSQSTTPSNNKHILTSSNQYGYKTYTYSSSGTSSQYRLRYPAEWTNRSLTGTTEVYVSSTNSASTTASYTGVGTYNNLASDYVLYNRTISSVNIAYPNRLNAYPESNAYYYNYFYKVLLDNDSYMLSEGAYLNTSINDSTDITAANNVRVGIPVIVNNFMYATSDNDYGIASHLYVYSAAGTYTPYLIRIIRAGSKTLQNVNVSVSGSTYTAASGSIVLESNNVEEELDKSINQTMTITHTTVNMPDNEDILSCTKVLKYNTLTSSYVEYESLNNSLYLLDGGIVRNKSDVLNAMTGEYESAVIDEYGNFPNAQVIMTFDFGQLLAAGTYRIQIMIGSSEYYIQFIIGESSVANIESATYINDFVGGSGTWINENQVTSLLTEIKYDAAVASLLNDVATVTPMSWPNITVNGYLTDLTISPYSTISSITYQEATALTYASQITSAGGSDYSSDTNNSKVYIVTYNLIAEDSSTTTFIHYFVEALLDTSIQYVYMDGVNSGTISSIEFIRTNTPVIKIFYDFAGIDFNDTEKFLIDIDYEYDITRYPLNGSLDNQLILNSIGNQTVSSNGISLTFVNDVACKYTITVTYTRTSSLLPSVTYEQFIIEKVNNTNSKITRIVFNSEAIFTGVNTIIYNGHQVADSTSQNYVPESTVTLNQSLLNLSIYNILYANYDLRHIKSLPNMIYYNDEEPKQLTDPASSTIKYNRYDVIGYVSKTDLVDFTPLFSLPVGAVVYQLDSSNNPIVDENNDFVLNANFISDDPTMELYYVHYRVYSEASPVDTTTGYCIPNEACDNYTDYYISIVDLAYNVYFTLEFKMADAISNSSILSNLVDTQGKMLLTFNRYQELIENNTSIRDNEVSSISNIFYFFTDVEGVDTISSYEHELAATSSGYFKLFVDLPEGYTYTYTFSGDNDITHYTTNDYFYVISKVITMRYTITITIDNAQASDIPWGQHGSTNIEDLYHN